MYYVNKPRCINLLKIIKNKTFLTSFFIILVFSTTKSSEGKTTVIEIPGKIEDEEFILNIKDIKYTNNKLAYNYTIYRSFWNPLKYPIFLNYSEGAWFNYVFTEELKTIFIYDNIGNEIIPIIENTSIKNPILEIEIPSNFTYKITIHIEPKTYLYGRKQGLYVFNITRASHISYNFTINIPSYYTIFNITKNPNIITKNNYDIYKLFVNKDENFNIYLSFLPFVLEDISGTLRLKTYTIEIPEIFPQRSYEYFTEKSIIEFPTNVGGVDFDPHYYYETEIPGDKTSIEYIKDGLGLCERISRPLDTISEDTIGTYYINTTYNDLIVYPRYHFKEKFYEYMIEIKYIIPKEDIYKKTSIYTLKTHLVISERIYYPSLKYSQVLPQNVTDFTVNFLLPNNAIIIKNQCTPSGVTIGKTQDDRNSAQWNLKNIVDIEENEYVITFLIKQVYDSFWLGIITIVIGISLMIILFVIKRSKLDLLLELIPLPYLWFVSGKGGLDLILYTPIMIIWITLIIIPFFPFIFKYLKERAHEWDLAR